MISLIDVTIDGGVLKMFSMNKREIPVGWKPEDKPVGRNHNYFELEKEPDEIDILKDYSDIILSKRLY